MMYNINEVSEDFSHQMEKGWFVFKTDKSLNFQVSSPIVWSGFA